MASGIAWMNGQWGEPDQLSLPLSDRGLLLADGLFETVLMLDGRIRLLDDHLMRWRTSAALLGMAPPPLQSQLEPLIGEAVERAGLRHQSGALRLNWSRGSGEHRGISPPSSGQHRFWLTLHPCRPTFTPLNVITSRLERRSTGSLVNRCKTFAYGASIQARREAEQSGAGDALLLNTEGELCCSTVANLLVKRDRQWLTPPLASGCLPGVMRGRAVQQGLVQEDDLGSTLQSSDQALLINSLSCRPLIEWNGQPLSRCSEATELWKQLID